MEQPTVIVGAGLAGVSAALALGEAPILLADADDAESASRAAVAGLANPLMAQRANLVWRADEALNALDALIEHLGVEPLDSGLLRPAASWKQMEAFRARAESHPHLARWHDQKAGQTQWPWLRAGTGVLEVLRGGAFDIPEILARGLDRVTARGGSVQRGWRLVSWTENDDSVLVEFDAPDGRHTVPCGRLLLCPGAGATSIPQLRSLKLHRIKGQLVGVTSDSTPASIRVVSGSGYVVPENGHLVVGSSYEHQFDSISPVRAVSRSLLAKAVEYLPWLEGATIEWERAGIRLTVPETRMPMVGAVPGYKHAWVFAGLGSKGLLTAPLVASHLQDWFREPDAVPDELRVREW